MRCFYPKVFSTTKFANIKSIVQHGFKKGSFLVPCGKCIACCINYRRDRDWET